MSSHKKTKNKKNKKTNKKNKEKQKKPMPYISWDEIKWFIPEILGRDQFRSFESDL